MFRLLLGRQSNETFNYSSVCVCVFFPTPHHSCSLSFTQPSVPLLAFTFLRPDPPLCLLLRATVAYVSLPFFYLSYVSPPLRLFLRRTLMLVFLPTIIQFLLIQYTILHKKTSVPVSPSLTRTYFRRLKYFRLIKRLE